MNIFIGSLALAFFVQIYWLIPQSKQNWFLIFGAIIFGVLVLPDTMMVAVPLSFLAYGVLSRGPRSSVPWLTAACLAPLIVVKFLPSVAAGFSFVGLSYFTFILIGVLQDLQRSKNVEILKADRFFAFLFFFPILPIGPIERLGGLGRQLLSPRNFNSARFIAGLLLIVLGVFKKVVIAEQLSELAVDSGRLSILYHGYRMWAFSFLSLLQVFADFSAIIDIVRGFSKLLGLEVVDNFDRPYLSDSIQDIWRRWHISLVSWLRDFVYTPIAMRTRSVMLASAAVIGMVGLWHEVSWRFAFWSVYWILIFWIAVVLRQNGIRVRLPLFVKRFAMITAMAFSTVFMLPSSPSELVSFLGNFFRLPNVKSVELNVSQGTIYVALAGFATVLVIDRFASKLNIRHSTDAFVETRPSIQAASLILGAFLLTLAIAFSAGNWEKFVYLRY